MPTCKILATGKPKESYFYNKFEEAIKIQAKELYKINKFILQQRTWRWSWCNNVVVIVVFVLVIVVLHVMHGSLRLGLMIMRLMSLRSLRTVWLVLIVGAVWGTHEVKRWS